AARLQLDPLPIVIIAGIKDILHDPPAGSRATEEGSWSQREILEVTEAASQSSLKIAAHAVRSETCRLIAARGEVLRQGRIGRIKVELPLGIELQGPLAGEKAAMGRVRPGGWCQCAFVPDALPGPS